MSKLSKILYVMASISLVCTAISRLILRAWIPFMWIPVGLFIFLFIAAIFIDRKILSEFLGTKTTKKGLSMGSMIFLMAIFLVALNFYGAWKYKTWDFSLSQSNTLSEQSVTLLKGLKSDLKFFYFYQKGAEGEKLKNEIVNLLKKYQDQSSFVKIEFVDVNERPDLVEKYGVKRERVVYLEYNGRSAKVDDLDEQRITSAIAKTFREKDHIVYFTEGHGERDLMETQQPQGLGGLKALLEESKYISKTVSLINSGSVPVDADMLVIAGPASAFVESETKAIEEYLKKGGSVLFALEQKTKHGLDSLLGKIGIKLNDVYVLSVYGQAMGHAFTPVNEYASHSITKPFGKEMVIFKLPGALEKTTVPASVTVEEIIKTRAESSLAVSSLTDKTAGTLKGPFVLGYSAKGKWPGADPAGMDFNIVIYPDADFLANDNLGKNLNRDLAINSIVYLAKEESMITITPKEVGVTKLDMSQTKWVGFLIFVVGLPLGLMIVSGYIWSRRRFA